MKIHRTDAVFGMSRDVPLNYVERANADSIFINNLTRNKHLIIHGSSKQGKTTLRKSCLEPDDYKVVQCQSTWELAELHASVLKEAGFDVLQSTSRTVSGKQKASVSLKGELKVPGVGGVSGSLGTGDEAETLEKSEFKPLDLDITDANDVIRALQAIDFSSYIILEDFHYLPVETQQQFAVALKAFHEISPYTFIIVGVWLEHDRLAVYNGDLTGRIVSINADEWSAADLERVIHKGEVLLNIRFSDQFVSELVAGCLESVYILQEVCHRACIEFGLTETAKHLTEIHPATNAAALIKVVVDQEAPRYRGFLSRFSDGFRDTALQMYRWILLPILRATAEQLEAGLKYSDIRKTLLAEHPEGADLKAANITLALQAIASLQVRRGITPIILDYDTTSNRLSIVDRSFKVWLANQDREELCDDLELPK